MTSSTPPPLIPLPKTRIAENTIRAHIVDGAGIDPKDYIRPAQVRRGWMDAVPAGYINRCIPLLAANTMGWELLNPAETTLRWDGGERIENIHINCEARGKFTANSHFGSGIATWYVPFLFRTSPDLGLYICGPGNHGKAGAAPLDAFVRTDWLPFPFTMNWRLTDKDRSVRFGAGEPIARILPFPLTLIDETELEITQLSSDPGFAAEVKAFGAARMANVAARNKNIQNQKNQDPHNSGAQCEAAMPSQSGVYNAQYVRAKGAQPAEGFAPHQTVFRPKMPSDKR